MKLRATDTTLL